MDVQNLTHGRDRPTCEVSSLTDLVEVPGVLGVRVECDNVLTEVCPKTKGSLLKFKVDYLTKLPYTVSEDGSRSGHTLV